MTKLEMQTIVTAVLKALEGAQVTPKASKVQQKQAKVDNSGLTEGQVKYRKSVAQLLRKRFGKDVDIQWNVNVLTFAKWQEKGMRVKKGEHGAKGLFHIDQVEPITA